METKRRLVLKHESGLYLSVDPVNMPHTQRLSKARRFMDAEQIAEFIKMSHYAPVKPSEYEIKEIEIHYREVEP